MELYKDNEQPIAEEGVQINSGQLFDRPRIIAGILEGCSISSGGKTSARIEIYPAYDPTIGIVQYNDAGEQTLKTILSGTDAGDIILGDYTGGKGALWDNSAGKFYVNGALVTGADSVINGTYIDSLSVAKLTSGTITAQAITLASSTASSYLNAGKTAFNNTKTGFILGVDHTDSKAKFYIGNTSNYLNWDGSALTISGSISATTGTIGGFTIGAKSLLAGTGVTRIQLDTSSGIHLGDDVFATAPFSVSLAGELKSVSGNIANWTISDTALSTGAFDTLNTMYLGNSGISLSNVFKVTSGGVLTATSGTIAGWEMQSDLLRSASSGARIELNKTKSRVSIFDATSEKVVMGYLNGLAKNDGTGNWGAGDYGFWAAAGDMLSIDGDGEYTSGDWIVRNDAAYLIHDASGNTIVRLGTDSGEKGLFIYDISGNQLAKYVSDEVFVGEATKYLKYTTAGGLEVMGDIVATSGKFGTTTNYWSVEATGLTAVSASTDVTIKYGKTDFGQDSTAGFILGYDYSATASKFEIGSSASKIFKYDGTDFSLTGGTITGGIIQTASGTGERVKIDSSNNTLTFYNSSNAVISQLGGGTDVTHALRANLNTTTTNGVFVTPTATGNIGLKVAYSGNNTIYGGYVELTGSSNSGVGLYVKHDGGGGNALLFQISNFARGMSVTSSSVEPCINITNSAGVALNITSTGDSYKVIDIAYSGRQEALYITGSDTDSTKPLIYAESNQADGAVATVNFHRTTIGPTMLITQTASSNNNYPLGIKMNISNNGTSQCVAFEFAGSEYLSAATSVSGLTGVIKVVTSDGLCYMPVYSSYS